MCVIEGTQWVEGAYIKSVDGEWQAGLENDGVDGKFLLEDVWFDGERRDAVWKEVFDPDAWAFDVVDLVDSTFLVASALVVEVVLSEDAGDFDFVPKFCGGSDDTADAMGEV